MNEDSAVDVLTISGLEVSYGPFSVLNGINLSLRSGDVLALIGANGAGKSTVLKTIAGFVRPTAGSVVFEGRDITGLRPHKVLARGCAYVAQGQDLFPQMTVRENVVMGAYQVRDRARIAERLTIVEDMFPMLRDKRAAHAIGLSGGERQQLKIARALMTEPRLLLLDEPTAGLSPKLVHQAFEDLERVRETTDTTLLIVEQNIRAGLEFASRGCVLELGTITHDVPAEELLRTHLVQDLFLGSAQEPPPTSADQAASADR